MRITPVRQFLAELPETDECVEWPFYLNKDGYAQTGGRQVSRIVYRQYVGPIEPEELTIDHTCFNPSCVNPRHLRLLPHNENARLQRSATKTHCVNGHEFTPENTYTKPRQRRNCRACNKADAARYREKMT